MNIDLFAKTIKENSEAIDLLRDELSPIGIIQLFTYADVPVGWLPCDGRRLKIDEYKELYDKIANRYGKSENGEFAIPDLRDLFVRGWAPESTRVLGNVQQDSMQKHGHKVPSLETGKSGNHYHLVKYDYKKVVTLASFSNTESINEVGSTDSTVHYTTSFAGEHNHMVPETTAMEIIGEDSTEVRIADETRPRNICLLYCIKAKSECSTLRSEIEQLKKEKLKWQSLCANYQRSEDALRKEKATLQIETISLQKKLDDECRIGWLWKACLALLLGVALGCAYATLFSKPQKADQQGAFSATHDISISKACCKEESKSEQTQKNEVSDAAAESNVTRQRSALELLRESAEQGDKKAQYELGLCYAKAKDVAQNWGEAFKWFERAARSNHVQAQSWLGWCYANGKGVNQDWLSSAKWYEKAATQGDALAQNQLGFYYENGQGVERDYTKAVGWYGRAAEQGQIDAQYRLGVCYELGNGVQKNFEIADKWYKKAAAGGQEQAKKIMSQQANDGRQNIPNDNLTGETAYITVAAAEPKETSAQRATQRLKELGVKSDDYNNEIFKIFKEEKNENQEILTKLELLIQAGACVNCVDTVPGGNGMTPLGCAAYKGWSSCLKFLLKQPQIKVNLKDKALECTPLFWAVRSGNVECVSALLSVPDIKVNEVNGKEKWTALLYAVYNNDLKSLEFLLRRNDVDVNAKENALGRTPLHCAAERGHKDCIRMLKEHPNIKLNEKDKNNKTPRELATDDECKNLLSE